LITLHRLNGDEVTLNAELIISVEATPDTHISMMDRRQVLVVESVDDVVAAVLDYRRQVTTGPLTAPSVVAAA
jgi:flagellar protein FlbD